MYVSSHVSNKFVYRQAQKTRVVYKSVHGMEKFFSYYAMQRMTADRKLCYMGLRYMALKSGQGAVLEVKICASMCQLVRGTCL